MKYKVSFNLDLRRNPYRGLYIAVEGIDAAGKTTQVKELIDYFKKTGKSVITTSEPRKKGGPFSPLIKDILTSKVKVSRVAFQYLFSADRQAHHEELIIPSLRQGKVVISHRCFWSAVTYGILDWMLSKKEKEYNYEFANVILAAQSILSMYHQFILPDYTFYLEISVKEASFRLSKMTKARELYEKEEKLEKIKEGYDWLVKKFPKEITVIDGEKDIDEVTREILSKL